MHLLEVGVGFCPQNCVWQGAGPVPVYRQTRCLPFLKEKFSAFASPANLAAANLASKRAKLGFCASDVVLSYAVCKLAHIGSHGLTLALRVDRADVSGTGVNVTIGTVQFDETLAVAPAEDSFDTRFP